MKDKTVNHIISDYYLTPLLQKYLIYDNDASQKGKGVGFHRRRLKRYLRKYFLENKSNEGYILLADFSGYYCNIPHDQCLEMLNSFIDREIKNNKDNETIKNLLEKILRTFRVDVSRFSDEEIEKLKVGKVDPQMNVGVPKHLLTGKKFLDKGVEIGNQISQNIGIIYAHEIDNYVKIVKGIKIYARYTDDLYAIAKYKEDLVELLKGIRKISDKYGLKINEKKTKIVKLSKMFRHLKDGYILTDTGKIICKINPENITKERQRLKSYKKLLSEGKITYKEIENIFRGWLGANWKRMSHMQIYAMHDLFTLLFIRKPNWKKLCSRLRWYINNKPKNCIYKEQQLPKNS